jgi:hypothetical protein
MPRGGEPVNRDDLKQYLALIDREIENGKLAIEKQRLLIEGQALSGRDQSEALATLARLRQAQRDLEDNRDQLAEEING